MQPLPVVAATFNKGREFLQLLTADGRLHICDLQVIAEMTVYIFVIIALGQFTELTVKAMSAEIVLTGGADAIAAPIAVG